MLDTGIHNKFRYHSLSDLPIAIKPSELQMVFGLSRSATYRLLHLPGFPVIRVGGTLRIPKEQLLLWMEMQIVENAPNQNPKIVGI